MTSQSPAFARVIAFAGFAFRVMDHVGTLSSVHFAAQYLAYMYLCQRFAYSLATVHA